MSPGKMLQRQLLKLGLDPLMVPNNPQDWLAFLEQVNDSYEQHEKLRILNENTIDQAMNEMERLNQLIQDQAEKKVKHSEEKLSQVIEAVPSIVAWVNNQGQVQGGNEQFYAFTKQNEEVTFAQKLGEIGFDSLQQFIEHMVKSPESEQSGDFSFHFDQETRYFKFIAKKFDADQMIVLVGVDLTSDILKNQELERAQAVSLSSSRMAVLGEMASGIAHEINNPLAVINSIVYQIKKRIASNQLDVLPERLAKIESTVMRITKIISGLKTFARDGSHDPFEPFYLKKIVDETLELATERLKNLDVAVKLDTIPEDYQLDCRATQISQVLLNLISNARDAIKNLNERWIHIGFLSQENRLQLFVEDSGSGIPLEVQEKIFRPFFTTKEVGVGTGLGLSISIGIIEAHHGKLYIDNSSAHTRFVIDIPQHQNEQPNSPAKAA